MTATRTAIAAPAITRARRQLNPARSRAAGSMLNFERSRFIVKVGKYYTVGLVYAMRKRIDYFPNKAFIPPQELGSTPLEGMQGSSPIHPPTPLQEMHVQSQ